MTRRPGPCRCAWWLRTRRDLLKPDMFASAAFAPPTGVSALYVPESAIQDVKGKTVVFAEVEGGKFAVREIVTGSRVGNRVEVRSGLEPSSRVVTTGALLLKSQFVKRGGL